MTIVVGCTDIIAKNILICKSMHRVEKIPLVGNFVCLYLEVSTIKLYDTKIQAIPPNISRHCNIFLQ